MPPELGGSPPRVWGRQGLSGGRVVGRRFTPTCVGKTTPIARGVPQGSVHPHVCGEDALPTFEKAKAFGSPPRVWGRRTRGGEPVEVPRFTPTCVGKTCLSRDGDDLRRVHPHVCGEDALRRLRPHGRQGSPPRVWGRLAWPSHTSKRPRFTPTCVGKTCRSIPLRSLGTVHPHVCGEDETARRATKLLNYAQRAEAVRNQLIAQQRRADQAAAAAEVLAQVQEIEQLDPTTTPDWRQRVAALRAALDAAYLERDADMPADLWDQALALEDAALRGPDYDPAALAEALAQFGDALATLAAGSRRPAQDRQTARERDQRARGREAAQHAAQAINDLVNRIELRHPEWRETAIATLEQLPQAWTTRLVQIPPDLWHQARTLIADLRGPQPPGPQEAGQALRDLARACTAYAQGWIEHPTVQPRPYE